MYSPGHTGHRLSRSCSAPAQRLVATPRGPRMTPALYPVNAARYYNATLHQRYNATLHQTNARHTAPVWRPTCSTEWRRRQQSAAPAGATDAHKLHYTRSHVKYTFQDPGFPGSHVQYTLQDPRFPRSHVRYTFQDPGFPRSHDKYKFQDPESSRSHYQESPKSHKYTFQDPESPSSHDK